jgi:hypothetical protein
LLKLFGFVKQIFFARGHPGILHQQHFCVPLIPLLLNYEINVLIQNRFNGFLFCIFGILNACVFKSFVLSVGKCHFILKLISQKIAPILLFELSILFNQANFILLIFLLNGPVSQILSVSLIERSIFLVTTEDRQLVVLGAHCLGPLKVLPIVLLFTGSLRKVLLCIPVVIERLLASTYN